MLNYILSFFDLIPSETFFWFCALAGSGMFAIQFLLNLFGVADHEDLDAGDVGDEGKFKWFSIQAITGFLMMFGWTAITCQKEFGFQDLSTISISITVGFLTIFITIRFLNLQKSFKVPEIRIISMMLLGKKLMSIIAFQKAGWVKFRFHYNILHMKLMPSRTIKKNCLHLCV